MLSRSVASPTERAAIEGYVVDAMLSFSRAQLAFSWRDPASMQPLIDSAIAYRDARAMLEAVIELAMREVTLISGPKLSTQLSTV